MDWLCQYQVFDVDWSPYHQGNEEALRVTSYYSFDLQRREIHFR